LTDTCGGNVYDAHVISITASTVNSSHPVRNIVDFDHSNNFFHSDPHASPQWIMYDFKAMRVTVTGYSLQSRHDYSTREGSFLISWIIEGSDKEQSGPWFVLDRRNDTNDIYGPSYFMTYEVAEPRECRFVRLRMVKDSYGYSHVILSKWELFGQLKVIGGVPS
jgi:hypothetical protein